MNDGVIGIVFSLVYVSLKEFGVVGSDTYTWGIKDFHKCWLGSLAKRRLHLAICLVLLSLLPGTRGYNIRALAGKLLTLRRQVSFEATLRLCGLNLLEGGRSLAPLEEFSLSTPGFFALAGSEQQQGN